MTTTHHLGVAHLGGHTRPVRIWSYVTLDQLETANGGPLNLDALIQDGYAGALAADFWTYDPDWTPPETVEPGLMLDLLLYVQTSAAGGGLSWVAHLYDATDEDREPAPVAASDIAQGLGVQLDTVMKWQARGVLPDPTWTVGGRPAWDWWVIERWARQTGRLKTK